MLVYIGYYHVVIILELSLPFYLKHYQNSLHSLHDAIATGGKQTH